MTPEDRLKLLNLSSAVQTEFIKAAHAHREGRFEDMRNHLTQIRNFSDAQQAILRRG